MSSFEDRQIPLVDQIQIQRNRRPILKRRVAIKPKIVYRLEHIAIIDLAAARLMAARVDSSSELESSHSPMLSMPDAVAREIADFAARVGLS